MNNPEFNSILADALEKQKVEESYDFHEAVMKITRKIEQESDIARLNAICEHYDIDLSDLLEWVEQKRNPVKTSNEWISVKDELPQLHTEYDLDAASRATEGGNMMELKLVTDHGNVFAVLPNGEMRILQAEVYGIPYYAPVRIGEKVAVKENQNAETV